MADTLSFEVENLHCEACVSRAEQALSAIPGAQSARVNLATHRGEVQGVAAKDVRAALGAAGYPAKPESHSFEVPDMHCASCVKRIEDAAMAHSGVLDARANLGDRTLQVRSLGADASDLIERVRGAGYAMTLQGVKIPAQEDQISPLARRFWLAFWLTLPVFLVEMGGHLFPPLHHWVNMTIGQTTSHVGQMVLTGFVLALPGRGFFARGLPNLWHWRPDMDSLVALGAGAAFLFSTVSVLAPGLLPEGQAQVYFEAAAVIVTLILLGRWLEARAKAQAGDAVRRLLDLAPETAERVRGDGYESVPVSSLRAGDLLRLRPGGRIAVDGVVESGESHVDESMLSGEPLPVPKQPGDVLAAGTLNGAGTLIFQATSVGADTQLARIAKLTAEAQTTRLAVEARVNRIAGWFVPAVLGVALVTCLIWLVFGNVGTALVSAVSVLIIACPCAMGLATPMSILVGTGRAAEAGVLFRGGDALERLQDVHVVAFDKTGTLTQGKPRVVDVQVAASVQLDEVAPLIAGVEAQSEHPLATAVLEALKVEAAEGVSGFKAYLGEGALAQVAGQAVAVGNEAMMASVGATRRPDWPEVSADQTAVFAAIDGEIVARFGIADQVRTDVAGLIADLAAQGRKPVLLSGDRDAVAKHVADQLGLAEGQGGLLPADKVDAIRRLRAAHGAVAFVGDGINDAPALAAADVGLAVGTANDAAIEAAGVVLVAPGLAPVARAFAISRATLRNIRQNLVWAFGYNVLLIPVAAGVLVPFGGPGLSPMLGAGAMALSSVMVVTNALRLKRARLAL